MALRRPLVRVGGRNQQLAAGDKLPADVLDIPGTDLGITREATNFTLSSSTGSNVNIPASTTSLSGASTAADRAKMNELVNTNWVTPTHSNNFSGLQYRRRNGTVEIQGALSRSSVPATFPLTIFTLPAGYRPSRTIQYVSILATDSGWQAHSLEVLSTGVVRLGLPAAAAIFTLTGQMTMFVNLNFCL